MGQVVPVKASVWVWVKAGADAGHRGGSEPLAAPTGGGDEVMQVFQTIPPAPCKETRCDLAGARVRDEGLLRDVEELRGFGGAEEILHRSAFPCGWLAGSRVMRVMRDAKKRRDCPRLDSLGRVCIY